MTRPELCNNAGDGVHPKRLHRNHQIEIRALNVTMPKKGTMIPAGAKMNRCSSLRRCRLSKIRSIWSMIVV